MSCLAAHETEVWARRPNVPLVRFARARAIEDTGLDLLGIADPGPSLVPALRGFDSIVSWYGANRPDFREFVASLGLPFIFLPAFPLGGTGLHAADFYLAQVRGLGAPCASDGIPRIPCPAACGDFAVIHPFASSPAKRWALERFQELGHRLETRMPVRWCAGPEDDLPGAVRIPDLYELACWLAAARVYVGNDSGIAHLAAAVGTPVVVLFGPTDPAVWAPRGPRVRVVASAAIDRIGVEDVLAAVGW